MWVWMYAKHIHVLSARQLYSLACCIGLKKKEEKKRNSEKKQVNIKSENMNKKNA